MIGVPPLVDEVKGLENVIKSVGAVENLFLSIILLMLNIIY